ncbi:MAG: sulfatase-like hydrolase/transferase, partial [Caulobacterales bacterium]|nr:sulfatase-like hydrolase/transferase [Caulobacterales bacterium]
MRERGSTPTPAREDRRARPTARAAGGATRRAAIAGGAAFALGAAAAGARAAEARGISPNVVFIMADDLGAHDLSCYGRPDYTTPRIDSLATDGVLLTQAYANSATCSPTRVALLSGRYQQRYLVGNYDPLVDGKRIGFPPDEPTLASRFRARGYHTGLVGKWHLGEPPLFGPLKSGYDEFFGLHGSHVDYFTHDRERLGAGGRAPDLFDGAAPANETGYLTDLITERSVAFIRARRAEPFFLSVHYTAPHWPWQTPDQPAA